MIHPSPALVVRADTPISECVAIMKKHDVGSLLVVSDDGKDEIAGIFTERDLVRKFDQIVDSGHWTRPVRTVMTRPVRTIELGKLDQAGVLMLKHGIRHLPVVTAERGKPSRLAGMISMRDLFRSSVQDAEDSARAAGPSGSRTGTPLVGVVTQDGSFLNLLRGLSRAMSDPRSQMILPDLEVSFRDFGLLVVDIDGMEPRKWSAALRRINRDTRAPRALIVFNPLIHPASTIKVVEQLSRSQRFNVFTKPVNIAQLAAHYFPQRDILSAPVNK